MDEEGQCQECSIGCEQCSSGTECDKCNVYTTLREGVCECEFNYKVTARASFGYITIEFFNLIFDTTVFDVY